MADYDDLPYIVVERRSAGIGAFLWGAAIGAGLALLYAPRSGKETRREIADSVGRVRNAAEDTVRQVQETMSGTLDDLRDQVSDRVESARRAMDAGRDAARATRADLERRIREAQAMRPASHGAAPEAAAPSMAEEPEVYAGDDGFGA